MRQKTSNTMKGLTLIELLVGLVAVSFLVKLAIPSFTRMQQQMRGTSYINAFISAIWLTRSEAIKRRHRVTMCASANGNECLDNGPWTHGWMVFLDRNGNGLREADEDIIHRHDALRHGWTGSGNTPVKQRISYVATGHSRLIGGGFQAGTVTFCPPHGQALTGSRVIINSTGRPRTEKIPSPNC